MPQPPQPAERGPAKRAVVTQAAETQTQEGDQAAEAAAACLKAEAAIAAAREEAAAAVEAQQRELVWCEHCAADGVHGRSMLSATVDRSVMDCRGLPAAQAGCCSGGHCECRHSGGL